MNRLLPLVMVFCLLISTVSSAAVAQPSVTDTEYNAADVFLDGSQVFTKGKDISTTAGTTIPGTIKYKGTMYLSLVKIAELFGLSVNVDGAVKLASKGSSAAISYKPVQFGRALRVSGSYPVFKTAFMETPDGTVINGLTFACGDEGVSIGNTYNLSLNTDYKLSVVYDGKVETTGIRTSGITLASFSSNYGAWETIIPANPSKGFHYPYILRFPKRSNDIAKDLAALNATLLAEGSNEHLTTTNDEAVSRVLSQYSGWYSTRLSGDGGYAMMMSMFPRPAQDGGLYTHSLDRGTLFSSEAYLNSLGRGNLYRIDKQFDCMIADAIKTFRGLGKTLDEKVFLIGFSASSDFATRFNYTHPDRAKAVVVNSAPTLPLTEYKGETLRFPLGVGDISEVTGQPFSVAKYKDTPQFWHTGTEDTNDGTYFGDGWGDYGNSDLNWNQEGIDYRRLFGDEIVARKKLISKVLNDAGFTNITHKEYAGVGHGWTDEIVIEALKFLDKNK